MLMLVLALGMSVACGGDDEEEGADASAGGKKAAKASDKKASQPIDVLRVAYKKTISEESAKVKFTTLMSGMPMGQTVDGVAQEGEFRMTGAGVASLDGDTSQFTMVMDMLGSYEVRQVDNVVYQKMPREMTAEIPGMKPWVAMNLDTFYEDQLGASYSELEAANPTDPTGQLEALRDVGSVEKIGEERVRGADTIHYRAVTDLREVAKEGGPDVQKAYDKMIEQMGTSKLTTDVWLDDEGRLRRSQTETTMKAPLPDPSTGKTSETEITMKMTQEMFDFGTPVKVSPPPPQKTMTQEELEQQVGEMQESMPPAPTT